MRGMSDMPAARLAVAQARRVCLITGAGVSVASGVPTFRDAGGLWGDRRPEDVATPEAFAHDPLLVWRWYHARRSALLRCEPNPAHRAIAAYQARNRGAVLITQNVDGLHERAAESAGIDERVLRFHGSIWQVRCSHCSHHAEDHSCEPDIDAHDLPCCPACGQLLRPAVIWFGELLDRDILQRAWSAAEACEVMIVAGTSAQVEPAASLARVAASKHAALIEVNPDESALSALCDYRFAAGAETLLPELLGE